MNALVKAKPASCPMAQEMLEVDPACNTEAMICSLRRHGFEPVKKVGRLRFPSDPKTGARLGFVAPLFGAGLKIAPTADCAAALAAVEHAMAPASEADIALLLAELGQVTARRETSGAAADLFLAAYIQRLREYPGDVVRDVLRNWPGTFFPKWGELKQALDERVAWRRMIYDALVAEAEKRSENKKLLETT